MAAQIINKHLQQHIAGKGMMRKYYDLGDPDVKGDQQNLKLKPADTNKKSPIYVHQFNRNDGRSLSFMNEDNTTNQNEFHGSPYRHEYRKPTVDVRSKSKSPIRNRTDSAPLDRTSQKPNKTYKTKQNVFNDRNTIAKLEESYWAKWKPSSKQTAGSPPPSYKQPTESFEKPKVRYRVIPRQKEKGDSQEIGAVAQTKPQPKEEENDDKTKVVFMHKPAEPVKEEVPKEPSTVNAEVNVNLPVMLANENSAQTEETTLPAEPIPEKPEGEDDEFKVLKHTDSFILTSKKQTQEKSPYQQPKCIKLYKNTVSTTTSSYIRGGTYPLKSCLKKDKPEFRGNIRLGRPGSPLIVLSPGLKNKKKK